MSLSKKVAYNTIIQVASKAVSVLLGLALVAIIARYLGRSGFGEYTTIFTFASFFAIIADFGMTLVTTQMISVVGVDKDKTISNLLGLRLFSAIFFLSLAPIFSLFFPYNNTIKIGVGITSLSLFFVALNQILIGLFQKELRMDMAAFSDVIGRVFLLVGSYFACRGDFGIIWILAAAVFSTFITFFINYYFSSKFIKIKFSFDFIVWKEIISKSWPLGVTIFFNLIYLKADTFLLSLFKTQAEVGLYGAAYKVVDVLITIPFMFAGIALPIITSTWNEGIEKKFRRVVQKSFDAMVILALPIFFGTQYVARDLMVLAGGQEFVESGVILKILIAAASIIFVGTVFSHIVIAVDRQKSIIKGYAFTALTSLIGYLIFIPRYSYFGAAYVTVYSEFMIAAFNIFLVWQVTKYVPSLKIFFKSLFSSFLMMLSLNYFVESNNFFISLIIAPVVYFLILYLLGGLKFLFWKNEKVFNY